MASFIEAYTATMRHEGGYSNHPADRGGETYRGIARRHWPSWGGWAIIDAAKQRPHFPESLAANAELDKLERIFYKMNFWNKLALDGVQHQAIATELFDTGVNVSTGVAATFLQRALNILNRGGADYPNLVVDGAIGPRTVATLNAHKRPADVLKVLNILQGNRYIEICEARETQEAFASGWLTRVSLQ